MRIPDKCVIEYLGFGSPRSFKEVQFEILGLKNLIKKAEERISSLEQSSFLAESALDSDSKSLEEYLNEQEE